jgi:hypothetical protein
MQGNFYFILLVTIKVTVNASHHTPIPIAGTIMFNYFGFLKLHSLILMLVSYSSFNNLYLVL